MIPNPMSERAIARLDVVRSAHGIVIHSVVGHEGLLWGEVQAMKKAIDKYEFLEDGGVLSDYVPKEYTREKSPNDFLCALCFKHISPSDSCVNIPPNHYHNDCYSPGDYARGPKR